MDNNNMKELLTTNVKAKYFGDTRYEKVWEQMKLLNIEDVTTDRQHKNGTIVWKLPIKNYWPGNQKNATCIEVASFDSGYVRNNNSGYSNYQLNKCRPRAEYFKDYKWVNDKQVFTGKYNKYICKERILIPIEIDRLEYLISYCLKNYYIKHANFVPNGDFVPKWQVESQYKYSEGYNNGYAHGLEKGKDDCCSEVADFQHEYDTEKRNLEDKLEQAKDKYKRLDDFYESSKVFNDSMYEGRNDRVKELEDKLDTIKRISEY